MKKLLILLVLCLGLVSCTSTARKEAVKKEICDILDSQTGDRFYFIYGLDNERSIATGVKYRGMIYSDKLDEFHILGGIEVAMESLDHYNINSMLNQYVGLINSEKIDIIAEKKAKEIFGEKTTLYNDGSTTEYMYNNIMKNLGNNLEFDKKSGYLATVVNVFVDDLDKLDITEFGKKTFELGKFLNEYMNMRTYLQVYVRDDKYLNDFDLTVRSIYYPFLGKKDIGDILTKLMNNKKTGYKLTEEEKRTLVYNFNKDELDFKKCHFKKFIMILRDPEDFPLKEEKSIYSREKKNGIIVYDVYDKK